METLDHANTILSPRRFSVGLRGAYDAVTTSGVTQE
jgi:hypothetical protein